MEQYHHGNNSSDKTSVKDEEGEVDSLPHDVFGGTVKKVLLRNYMIKRLRVVHRFRPGFFLLYDIASEIFPNWSERYICLDTDEGEIAYQLVLKAFREKPFAVKCVRDAEPPEYLRLFGIYEDRDESVDDLRLLGIYDDQDENMSADDGGEIEDDGVEEENSLVEVKDEEGGVNNSFSRYLFDSTLEKVILRHYMTKRFRAVHRFRPGFFHLYSIASEIFPDWRERYIWLNNDEGERAYLLVLKTFRETPSRVKSIRDAEPPEYLRLFGIDDGQDENMFDDDGGGLEDDDEEEENSLIEYATANGIHIIPYEGI